MSFESPFYRNDAAQKSRHEKPQPFVIMSNHRSETNRYKKDQEDLTFHL